MGREGRGREGRRDGKGRGGEEGVGKGRGREGRRGQGRTHPLKILTTPLHLCNDLIILLPH